MQTTLNEIKKYDPCNDSWAKGLKYLNKTKADDEPIELMTIHKVVGIKDAVWCLITQDYRDYCLFLADVVEPVLPLFEAEYPDDKRPRQAIKAIRDWYNGDITKEQLEAYADAAKTAANAASTAADAMYSASITNAAYTAYTAYAAYAAAGSYAGSYATVATSYAAYNAAYDIMKENWKKIDKLFIKHFGKK